MTAAAMRLVISETDAMVGARRSMSRSARARHDDTPKSPKAETMIKTVEATAKIPKVCGSTMRAIIAVTPMLDRRKSIVAPMFQRALRRTFEESVRCRCATAK
jgi:hypothetical protein